MNGVGYITSDNFAAKYGLDEAIVIEDLRAGDREGFRRQGVWFVADETLTPAPEHAAAIAGAPVGAPAAAPAGPVHAPRVPPTRAALHYSSRYSTTRAISKLIAFAGWIAALAGIAGVGYAALQLGKIPLDEATVMGLLPYLGAMVGGLFLVMGGQLTRATVDNADQTRLILQLLEHRA